MVDTRTPKVGEEGFFNTFDMWPVNDDWMWELYNFIIHGLPPGSFHTSCFSNDLLGAAAHSHVSNQWQDIVAMMKWMNENAPNGSWGNRENVKNWVRMDKEESKEILIKKGYLLTDKEITWQLVSK